MESMRSSLSAAHGRGVPRAAAPRLEPRAVHIKPGGKTGVARRRSTQNWPFAGSMFNFGGQIWQACCWDPASTTYTGTASVTFELIQNPWKPGVQASGTAVTERNIWNQSCVACAHLKATIQAAYDLAGCLEWHPRVCLVGKRRKNQEQTHGPQSTS